MASQDNVVFSVSGQIFTVAIKDLCLARSPESCLTRAVTTASSREDPICIDGDPELFPHLLAFLQAGKCHVPASLPKAAILQEAQKFGLTLLAEDVIVDGDGLQIHQDLARSDSDTVVFSVSGKLFEVFTPNLRPSVNQNSFLMYLLQARSSEEVMVPIDVPGASVDLFPYVLSIHRYGECNILQTINKSDVLRECKQVFKMGISAESIIQEGDSIRDGGQSWFEAQGSDTAKAVEYFGTWSVDKVRNWLQTMQGGRFDIYADKFFAAGIDGPALASITHDSLTSLGIRDPKKRNVLLAAISDAPTAPDEIFAEKTAGPQEQQDAAALNLLKIFGPDGKKETFTTIIDDWRQKECTGAGHRPTIASKTGIFVASRVRPLLADGPDKGAVELGDFDVVSVPAAAPPRIVVHQCKSSSRALVEHKSFAVHCSLEKTCKELDVFDLAKPLVETSVAHNMHVTLLCYGQTGSGKTHTMGRLAEHIIQQLFCDLKVLAVALEAFELAGGTKGVVGHGNHVFSLNADDKPELAALEGKDGAVHVGGSSAVLHDALGQLNLEHCAVASSPKKLEQLFRDAESRRCSKDTHRNAESSRTHAFYRFHVLNSGETSGTGSCVQLVDLAGSESAKDCLYHDKETVDERAQINASLMALCTCIEKHSQGASFVPFRSSKLTQLLRPCFVKNVDVPSGTATVLFLACLSPLASDSQQSMRTLGFTEKLANVPKTGLAKSKARPRAFPFIVAQLKRAVASGDVTELNGAILEAKKSGAASGVEYQSAVEALRKLDEQATAD